MTCERRRAETVARQISSIIEGGSRVGNLVNISDEGTERCVGWVEFLGRKGGELTLRVRDVRPKYPPFTSTISFADKGTRFVNNKDGTISIVGKNPTGGYTEWKFTLCPPHAST